MITISEKQLKQLNRILKAVYKHCDIGPDAILDRYRQKKLVLIRRAIWFILYKKHGWTMVEIGKVFLRTHPNISRGIYDFQKNSKKKDYKEILAVVSGEK